MHTECSKLNILTRFSRLTSSALHVYFRCCLTYSHTSSGIGGVLSKSSAKKTVGNTYAGIKNTYTFGTTYNRNRHFTICIYILHTNVTGAGLLLLFSSDGPLRNYCYDFSLNWTLAVGQALNEAQQCGSLDQKPCADSGSPLHLQVPCQ